MEIQVSGKLGEGLRLNIMVHSKQTVVAPLMFIEGAL